MRYIFIMQLPVTLTYWLSIDNEGDRGTPGSLMVCSLLVIHHHSRESLSLGRCYSNDIASDHDFKPFGLDFLGVNHGPARFPGRDKISRLLDWIHGQSLASSLIRMFSDGGSTVGNRSLILAFPLVTKIVCATLDIVNKCLINILNGVKVGGYLFVLEHEGGCLCT